MRPVYVVLVWIVLVLNIFTRLHAADPVDYVRDIKPILRDRCYSCHGALDQKADLRLDSGQSIHTVIKPKSSAESLLITRISSKSDDERMPPEGAPLTAEQISRLKSWIDAGAKYPADDRPETDPTEHWAFRRPTRPALPQVGWKEFSNHPVDRLVAAEWERRKLVPVPPADKRLLLRRLYLDLIGIPPTPDQIHAFLENPAPDAYSNEVDRLLASPQYGERWARHFLDIWRYSDWWGLGAEVRNSQKHMWHWRDWAVEAFNADLGYDAMIREMLAADELHPTQPDKLRATGYLARQYFRFNRNTWMDETVEHTAKAFLGLTWNCARCHDHKYDPIRQEDYYRFRAFFEPYQVRTDLVPGELNFEKNGIPRVFDCNLEAPTVLFIRGDDKRPSQDHVITPGLPKFLAHNGLNITAVKLPPESYAPQIRSEVLATYLAQAKTEGPTAELAIRARHAADVAKATGTEAEALELARKAATAEKRLHLERAQNACAQAEAELAKTKGIRRIGPARKLMIAKDQLAKATKALENPGTNYTPLRGALKTPESNLETEASLSKPFPRTSSGRRSALAQWIANQDNPLTARVLVNHVWLRHFGRPLVDTVFDFGRKGTPPTNPDLLDWLAVEFMERGWSIKHLHRVIVTSQVYRLSAKGHSGNHTIDPENRFNWRRSPQRMDAPTIRDSLLHLAGDLDLTRGGPAVPLAQQTTSQRRSLYFFQSHNEHNPFLGIFDDANVLECYRRTESIVPQQALALSNSRFAMGIATKIADRIKAPNDENFIAIAFAHILGALPGNDELKVCLDAMDEFRRLAPGTKELKDQTARVRLIHSLLNHNDFVTIR